MTYKENYTLIDWSKPITVERKPKTPLARSDLPCPIVISDAMDPVQSMLDGKCYTSKSLLRSTYKAAGVTEVGNDPARLRPKPKPVPDRKAIRASLERAKSRLA